MSERAAVYVVCKMCGHEKSAFKVLNAMNKLPAGRRVQSRDIAPYVRRLKCECGAKGQITIDVREPRREFVATAAGANLRYHRPTCRWMNNVALDSLVNFGSRESAERSGYTPCSSCRP